MQIIKTLMWHELLPLGLGVYLGVVVQAFFESVVSTLVMPYFDLILPDDLGRSIYSDLIKNTITLIIAMIILYIVVKVIIWRNGMSK